MKKQNKGFVVPLLIAIIAIIAAGSSLYVYESNKNSNVDRSSNTPSLPTETNTDTQANTHATNKPAISPTDSTSIKTTTKVISPKITNVLPISGPNKDTNLYRVTGTGFGASSIVNVTLISSPFPNVTYPKYFNGIKPTSYSDSELNFTFPSYTAGSSPGTYNVEIINSNSSGQTSHSNTMNFAITPPVGM